MTENKAGKTDNFRSLTVTLALAFLFLTLTILLLSSFLELYLSFQSQQQNISKEQNLIAQNAADTVKSFIQEKNSILKTTADLSSLTTLEQLAQKGTLDKLLGRESSFRQLIFLDTQNQEKASVSRLSKSMSGKLIDKFDETTISDFKQGKEIISQVYIDPNTSEPMIVITTPVKNIFGDFQGTLLAEVNLKFMWDLVSTLKIGKTGQAFVVDKKGNLLAYGDISRVLKGENVKSLPEVAEFTRMTPENHVSEIGISKGINGNTVVTTHIHLDIPDWAVVVEMPISEAYGTVIYQFEFTLFIILSAAVFTMVVGISLSRKISWPIITLRDAAEKIKEGNLNTRIVVQSDNEIGQLAKSFNQMAVQLQQSYGLLEQKVKERTAELEEAKKELEMKLQDLNKNKSAMLNLLEDAKNLENDLKIERDRAKAIVSSIGEGLVVVDGNYKVIQANLTAENLLEIHLRNLIGSNWIKTVQLYIGEQKASEEERTIIKTIKQGKSFTTDINDNCYYICPSGKKFPITTVTTPLIGEKINGAVIVFRDVTKDKEVQKTIEKTVEERTRELNDKTGALRMANDKISEGWLQLQEEKATLSSSIQNLSLGFILFELDGNILTMNQNATKLLSIDPYEKSFNNIEKLFPAEINLHDKHVISTREKRMVELKDVLYSNKFLHIYFSPIIITEKNNEVIGTVCLIEDITEAKSLERSRNEFFSIASHELRTPLTAIRGNTSLIQEFYKDKLPDEEIKEMIADIHESAIRLIDIVNDFLDMSRLEQGKMEFKKEKFDICALINEVLKEFQTTGSQKKLYMEYHQPSCQIPMVQADRNRTKQVLFNLLGNGLKFTEEGGITIDTEIRENNIAVRVKDTGHGIPKEAQPLLFRKFQQAEENILTRDATRGTGLGLYISRLMIEGMKGEIHLEYSEAGIGSSFVFTLPVVEQNSNAISSNSPVPVTITTQSPII